MSHQIAVNVLDYSDGGKVEADLEKANINVIVTLRIRMHQVSYQNNSALFDNLF